MSVAKNLCAIKSDECILKMSVILVIVTVLLPSAFGQEVADCYGAGSVAGAAIGAFVAALLLVAAVFYLRKLYWKSRKGELHLVF